MAELRVNWWRVLALVAISTVLLLLARDRAVRVAAEAEGEIAQLVVPPAEEEKGEVRLDLRPEVWADLPGWEGDKHGFALAALQRSCRRFALVPDHRELKPREVGGRMGDWRAACRAVLAGDATDHAAARGLFEEWFRPFRALDGDDGMGLFTGYYEPLLFGSRIQTERYRFPLYRPPRDMVTVELGAFRDDLAGRKVAGRIAGRRFVPYFDRAEIAQGALGGRGLELVWVDDPVDVFFLHVQGSGRVQFEDGTQMRVGYAGQNGHEYFAVGRALIDWGEVPRPRMSMQAIRGWLEDNPEELDRLLDLNRSFVFFRELRGDGPLGSQGVALTAGRSLAVDRRFLPMGVPIWLDTRMPKPAVPDQPLPLPGENVRLRRLMVAQDTGGAIRGPVRGDVFFGFGERAADLAGRMKGRGRYWILLPKSLAERRARLAAPDE